MKIQHFAVLCWIIFLLTSSFSSQAQSGFQSPYQLSWQLDIPMGAVAVGMGTAYLIMDAKTKPLSFAEIQALDRNNVSAFDRDATYHWSKPIKTTSDIFLYTSMGVHPYYLLIKKYKKIIYRSVRFGHKLSL